MHSPLFTTYQFQFTCANPQCLLGEKRSGNLTFHFPHLDFTETNPVHYFAYHLTLMEYLDANAFHMDPQGIIYCGACKELFASFKKSSHPIDTIEHELLSDEHSQYKILWLVIFSLLSTMQASIISTFSGKTLTQLPIQFLSWIQERRYLFLEQLLFNNPFQTPPDSLEDAMHNAKTAKTPGNKGASADIHGKIALAKYYKQASEHLLDTSAYATGFAAILTAHRIPNFYKLIAQIATGIQTKIQQRQTLAITATQAAEDNIQNSMAIITETVAEMLPLATAILPTSPSASTNVIPSSDTSLLQPRMAIAPAEEELDAADAALVVELKNILRLDDPEERDAKLNRFGKKISHLNWWFQGVCTYDRPRPAVDVSYRNESSTDDTTGLMRAEEGRAHNPIMGPYPATCGPYHPKAAKRKVSICRQRLTLTLFAILLITIGILVLIFRCSVIKELEFQKPTW